jgi:phosphatidyl-myo-inositol dimannoside synthase
MQSPKSFKFSMKKVLLLSSEFPPGPGGIGFHAFSLSKALYNEGVALTVLTPADYSTPQEVAVFDQNQPFEVVRYKRYGSPYTYLKRWVLTKKIILNHIPQTIILTGKFSLWQGILIKKMYPHIKTIAILHGSEVNLQHRLWRKITHKAIDSADIIVPVSQFTKSLLPKYIFNNKTNKTYVIPNGIETPIFNEKTTNNSTKLKGFPSLLTVGHVSPRKGQHRVIKALPTIIKKYPNVHYHIVGRPLDQKKLEDLSQQLGVEHHITFHGVVKQHQDLESYYKTADVFMLLSENQPNGDVEGFGIVALEANLFGTPVVGAKFCGVEDAVCENKSGKRVNGDDANEVLSGIEYCVDNLADLEKSSIDWAMRHQWKNIVSQFLQLI